MVYLQSLIFKVIFLYVVCLLWTGSYVPCHKKSNAWFFDKSIIYFVMKLIQMFFETVIQCIHFKGSKSSVGVIP